MTPGAPVAILVDLQGPKIRLGKFADGPHDLAVGDIFKITIEDIPGTKEIVSTTFKGLPERRQARRLPAHRRRQGARRGRRGRRHRRHDQGHRRRPGLQQQGHQPPRRGRQRAGAVREGRGRPALGRCSIGADLIALSFVRSAKDVAARPRDHGGRGPPRPGHRQDREAAGRRAPRGDHRRVRRRSWSPAATWASSCRWRPCRSCRSAPSSCAAAWPSRSSSRRRCSSR